ncbi:hypothetical protein ACWFPY_34170 [Nocardia fluminea]
MTVAEHHDNIRRRSAATVILGPANSASRKPTGRATSSPNSSTPALDNRTPMLPHTET